MKKSLRILSLVLAIVMIAGSMSVMGSAYTAYRGNDVKNSLKYDDVDTASLSIDQYASMALDEIDRMLAEENLVVDIYIGELNLSDVDTTLSSVVSVVNSVGTLLKTGLLGDQAPLLKDPILELDGVSRASTGDLQIFYKLLDLIGSLGGVLKSYVNGTIGLGVLNSFIQEYVFNVRELVFGLLMGVTGLYNTSDHEFDFFDGDTVPAKYATSDASNSVIGDTGALVFIQDILNGLVLGDWQKLDDQFYDENTNPNSHVVASEYIWSTKSGSTLTKLPDDEPIDTTRYDYYGYVHPEWWVTFGLGDAIRVANNGPAPDPSYTKVDVISHVTSGQVSYDLIENLILQAYNGIAVPVLNRITKQWLREKAGFYFDPAKTEKYVKDAEGNDIRVNGEKVISDTYDYMYMGEAVTGAEMDDIIFSIFDPDLVIPRAYAREGHTFIEDLNSNAVQFALSILKTTGEPVVATKDGITTYTATWSGKDWQDNQQTFTLTLKDKAEDSNELLFENIANVARFVLKITGDGFFSKEVAERGEVITDPSAIDRLTDQQLCAYIIRSVINASVDYMYIEPEYDTIAEAGFRAVQQLMWQDLPQFTYTMPERSDYNDDYEWYQAIVEKALAALMDLAAYNVNQGMDTNTVFKTTNYSKTNIPGNNGTGLLGYLGDVGSYGDTITVLAAWAFSKYAPLLNIEFTCDNYNGAYDNLDVWDFWSDFDALLNAIIPISDGAAGTPDQRAWIAKPIAEAEYSAYDFLMNHVIMAVVDADLTPFTEVFDKNPNGAFAFDNLETVIVDLLHRIFDDLFPGVFTHNASTIDAVLNNTLLGNMVENLAYSLSYSKTYTDSDGNILRGRGEQIAFVALPLVCMILGLDGAQEFEEMQTYMPSVFSTTKKDDKGNIVANTTTSFEIFNGSSGINTSYRDKDAGYARKVDNLFTYRISSATCTIISGTDKGKTLNVSGIANGTEIEGGETATVNVSGYSEGQVLEMTINYFVLDESGQSLTKDANNSATTLTNVAYAYVGRSAEGDDTKLQTINIGGQNILYTSDVYLSGGKGLSSLDSYSFRIKNESGTGTVTVKNVTVSGNNQFVKLEGQGDRAADFDGEITQSLTGEGGTYVFSPFVVDDNAFRTEWTYQKDENGNYVYDDCDMKIKDTKVVRTAPQYEVQNGDYTITTTVQVGSSTDSFDTRVHLYDDYGLEGLFNNAVAANRTTSTITQEGQEKFTDYSTTLKAVAAFVLQPRQFGANFTSHISTSDPDMENKYEELYRDFYVKVKEIKNYEVNAGAQAIWNTVNATEPYNYTRTSFTLNGKTYFYQDKMEFNESGYGFFGIRNFVPHTFNVWREARNDANSLINREFFYVPYISQEDYNALSASEKAKWDKTLEDYETKVANAAAISSVESAYAIHRLTLASARLIPLNADKTKLVAAIAQFSTLPMGKAQTYFSAESLAEYNTALAFANTTNNSATATPQQVNEAMSRLIETWKQLMRGADYVALDNLINGIKTEFMGKPGRPGLDPTNNFSEIFATYQTVYSVESLTALIQAIRAGQAIERGLSVSEQNKIDAAAINIQSAYAALKPFQQGGDDPGDEPGDEPTEGSWALPDPESEEYGDYAIYHTSMEGYYYAPMVDDGYWLDCFGGLTVGEYAEDPYAFGFAEYGVDYILYGISEEMLEEDVYTIFSECEGYEIAYDCNDWGLMGTGSYVYLIPESEDEEPIVFMVVLRGDTDGSSSIDYQDSLEILNYIIGEYEWDEPSCITRHFKAAGDIDGSGEVDYDDVLGVLNYIIGEADIYQPLGNWYAPDAE